MHTFDFSQLPEAQRVACFGTFFAMAAADGKINRSELTNIYEALDTEGMTESSIRRIHSWVITPPTMDEMLAALHDGSPEVRFGVMTHLLEVARADRAIHPFEQHALDAARARLRVSQAQYDAILSFLDQASLIQEGKLDKSDAKQALRNAAAGLSGVGVPLAALLFSCTVSGLGLADGLAGLDMGLGLAPAIGMVMLLGVATFAGVSWILGRTEAEPVSETTSRAQHLINNLGTSIEILVRRIDTDEDDASTQRKLRKRLNAAQRMLARSRNRLAKVS